jgi:hypothetical protein
MHLKITILILLFCVFMSLGFSFYYLVVKQGQAERVAKMLSWCLLLAASLLVLLLIAFSLGWIMPHGWL